MIAKNLAAERLAYRDVGEGREQDAEAFKPRFAPARRLCPLGAPARPGQKLTSSEFRKQHEIVIASCKSSGEMGCRV